MVIVSPAVQWWVVRVNPVWSPWRGCTCVIMIEKVSACCRVFLHRLSWLCFLNAHPRQLALVFHPDKFQVMFPGCPKEFSEAAFAVIGPKMDKMREECSKKK